MSGTSDGQREENSQVQKNRPGRYWTAWEPSEVPGDFIAELLGPPSQCAGHLGNKAIFLKKT
jgi:hypothetical protein